MSEQKPREFWIYEKSMHATERPTKARNVRLSRKIHVIEKSAYDALLADAMKLREALAYIGTPVTCEVLTYDVLMQAVADNAVTAKHAIAEFDKKWGK